MLDRALKIWNTVKYMKLRQWKYRLFYTVRNTIKKRVPKVIKHSCSVFLLPTYYSVNIKNRDIILAEGILKNKIPTVSGKNVDFSGDWDLKGEQYRLVCFKLNSFRWLINLSDAYKTTGDDKYIKKGTELIKDWYFKCGHSISGDKWNAYVIAERIENWIAFCSEYDAENVKQYANWIYPQANELRNSIEFQLGANHILSEAKALVFAGRFLNDDALYRFGKKILVDEAKTQFLQDGGHYERSVSYHIESLQQYFEAYAVMRIGQDSDAGDIAKLMIEPYRYLNGIIGVNGKIPLFNDSAYDYPFFDAADFLSTAEILYGYYPPNAKKGSYYKRWSWVGNGNYIIEWNFKTRYENTGYIHYQFGVGENKYSFYMDTADCGPDENLGHAHADALSILLSSDCEEILVDSGVFTYVPGDERNYCRSTKAHNTVEVDGKNSAEIWSAFRVAKRGHTKVIEFDEADGLWIKASHDGYKKILKDSVEHIREVSIHDGRIEVFDKLLSKDKHIAVSRFHIGSDCTVDKIDNNTCIINNHIRISNENELNLVDCEVAGMFGIRQRTKCIEIDFKGKKSNKTTISIE